MIGLGVAAVGALLAVMSAAYVADNLGAQESDLARQIHNGAPLFAPVPTAAIARPSQPLNGASMKRPPA